MLAVFLSKISPKQDFIWDRAYFFIFVAPTTAAAATKSPAGCPSSFNFFFLAFHEYHLWFSNFVAKNIREYHQKWPNNQWNPGHKIKKICAVSIEILLWWYFGQKYSFLYFHTIPTNNILLLIFSTPTIFNNDQCLFFKHLGNLFNCKYDQEKTHAKKGTKKEDGKKEGTKMLLYSYALNVWIVQKPIVI